MERCELLLNDRQRLATLLYLARRLPASRLMATLEGAVELSLLRLPAPDRGSGERLS